MKQSSIPMSADGHGYSTVHGPQHGNIGVSSLTSLEYQRLKTGVVDQNAIRGYIQAASPLSFQNFFDSQCKSAKYNNSELLLLAGNLNATLEYEKLRIRENLVLSMNHSTLQALARHYGIPLLSELLEDNSQRQHFEQGPVLKRLSDFLKWELEYFGVDHEIQSINVESVLMAISNRKGPLPSANDSLETILRYVCAKKKVPEQLLIQALKDCVTINWVCKESSHKLKIKLRQLEESIAEKDDDSDDEESARLLKMEKEREGLVSRIESIRIYQSDFSPGVSIPDILERDAVDRFSAQFIPRRAIGSLPRLAWLIQVFGEFWKKYDTAYLALDPDAKARNRLTVNNGIKGGQAKAEKKWKRFTEDFAEYMTIGKARLCSYDAKWLAEEAQKYGRHCLDDKMPGATDKRTVDEIVNFLTTLGSHSLQDIGSGLPGEVHRILRDGAVKNNSSICKRSSFSTLSIDTVEACLKILHDVIARLISVPSNPPQKRMRKSC